MFEEQIEEWGSCPKCAENFLKNKKCHVYCDRCRKPSKKKPNKPNKLICDHNRIKTSCIACGYY